jgi:hypothetical protein
MIIIISCICVSVLLVALISYRNYQIQNENNQDIRTFLLADSIEEDDYHYNPDLI